MFEGNEMKTLRALKRELLANTKTRSAYEELADELALARERIAVRCRRGLGCEDRPSKLAYALAAEPARLQGDVTTDRTESRGRRRR